MLTFLALMLHAWMGRISDHAYRWLLRVGAVILAAYGLALFARARR